jgi:hypothetical protein
MCSRALPPELASDSPLESVREARPTYQVPVRRGKEHDVVVHHARPRAAAARATAAVHTHTRGLHIVRARRPIEVDARRRVCTARVLCAWCMAPRLARMCALSMAAAMARMGMAQHPLLGRTWACDTRGRPRLDGCTVGGELRQRRVRQSEGVDEAARGAGAAEQRVSHVVVDVEIERHVGTAQPRTERDREANEEERMKRREPSRD